MPWLDCFVSAEPLDVARDLRQIVVELVIALLEEPGDGSGDRLRIQTEMLDRHGLVLAAVIEKNRNVFGQPRSQIRFRFDFLARPPAFADEGRRNEEDARNLSLRSGFGKSVDEKG